MLFKQRHAHIALGSILVMVGLLGAATIGLAGGDAWTKKADMPTPRAYLSTSVVDGKIYAIGGLIHVTAMVEAGRLATDEYDLATDTWISKADMPTDRWGLSTSVVGGKIYAIGGTTAGLKPLSTVEEYDPATDTWTKKADMPTARIDLSTSVVGGKIYAIGGGWEDLSVSPPPAFIFPTVEEYDPATDTWTKKSDMPTARTGLRTSVVNGKIYAIGGAPSWEAEEPALRCVEEYDPATDTWTRKADMPTGRWALSTSVVGGRIYAIGGELYVPSKIFSTVEVYDPVTDVWMRKADMPAARANLSTNVVDEKIYAIGGSRTSWKWEPVSTVEEYDPEFVSTGVVVASATMTPAVMVAGQSTPLEVTVANEALVQRVIEGAFNRGNLDVADEAIAPSFVRHKANVPGPEGPEGYRQFVKILRTAFPDLRVTIEDMIAEGDKVAIRQTYRGTHKGDLMGNPPTDRQVTFTGMCLYRIADGKIAEEWIEYDALGMMQQIGAVPPMSGTMPALDRRDEDYPWSTLSDVIGDPGDPETNKAVVRRNTDEVWNQVNVDVIEEIYASHFVNHDPVWPGITGDIESYKVWAVELHSFPDMHETMDDIIAEGDKVVSRWTVRFTDPSSGKQLTGRGMDIWRFADGKIVERWSSKDFLGLAQQMMPPAGEAD